MIRRFARVVGVAALVLSGTGYLAGSAAHARPAAVAAHATKTYSSKAYSYSFTYAADWKLVQNKGVDIALTTADRHALLLAIVQKGTDSAATIKSQLKELVAVPGKIQGKAGYAVQPINGVSYQGWQAVDKTNTGTVQVLAIGTAHGKFTYYFLIGVYLKQPTTKQYTALMGATVNSITLR